MLSPDKLTDHSLLFRAILGCNEMECQEDSMSVILHRVWGVWNVIFKTSTNVIGKMLMAMMLIG